MKKRTFWVNGKKYNNEEDYIAARDAFLAYEDEQTAEFKKNGYDNGYTILAGEQSEIVTPQVQNDVAIEDITLEWLHEQHKASHSDSGFRLWVRTFLMRRYNIDVDSVSYIMQALNA